MPTFATRAAGALLMASAAIPAAHADRDHDGTRSYTITITNLTRGESFTPFLAVSHRDAPNLIFTLGQPASSALADLAEGGVTGPLMTQLTALPAVKATALSGGLLPPGQSTTITLAAPAGADHVSLAAMMVPTNDGFVSVQNVPLPRRHWERVVTAPAYDAGAEADDELCADIPGPTCGGQGISPPGTGEGYVFIHAGIHGIGDLAPADYDWRNPVAKIVIRQVGH